MTIFDIYDLDMILCEIYDLYELCDIWCDDNLLYDLWCCVLFK